MRRILALGVSALALVACGGGDDDDGADVGASGDGAVASDDEVDSGGGDGGGDDEDADESDDSGSGSMADSIPACGLFTVDDLTSRGVGIASGPDQVESGFGSDQCTFADDVGSPVAYVTVSPPADGSGAIGDAEVIPGIGAQTIYSPAGRAIIVELDDGSTISISIGFSVPPEDARDVLIGLAEIAAG